VNYGNKLTAPFETKTKEEAKLDKRLEALKKKKMKEEDKVPKQKRTKIKKEQNLKQLDKSIDEVISEKGKIKPKIVQDRDRRKDDLVSGIKILAHNLVILLGILVGWKGISKRRTRKILDYVIRRQGYIEEFGAVIVIRIIAPYKKRIKEDISDFIKEFNKIELKNIRGKIIKLAYIDDS
jgi:hypothetical protein